MMKQLFSCLVILLAISLFSCNSSTTVNPSAAKVDLSLYTTEKVPGTNWTKVTRNHSSGELYEEGFVENGYKVGTWITYFPQEGYTETITSYLNGVFTGPFLEFDQRGRMAKQANYVNNQLDGLYGEFKAGRPVKQIMYKEGAINGFFKEYNSRSELIKQTSYKNNVLDGPMQHFNDEGKVVLEYIYKNGEKISGGIIE
jgi:antitoxin component YwqK of YwqJK toxin-antitoxin module